MELVQVDVLPDEPYFPAHYAAAIAETAEQQGIDPLPYLRHAGLSRTTLLSRDILISRDQCRILLKGILENDVRGFGLQNGHKSRFEDFGMLGYAMYSSATLGRAIERQNRYLPLMQPFVATRLVVQKDKAMLESPVIYDDLADEPAVKRYCLEDHFASWQVISISFQEQPHWFDALFLDLPEDGYKNQYEEFFGCPVYFGQPISKCVFPRDLLDAPFAFANHREARIAEGRCQAMLADILHKGGVVGDIHHLLSRSPGQFPQIGDVATQLGMSERTLRRRLQDAGTTYRQVLGEYRLDLAGEYLRNSALPAQEIAVLVGYSEPASFHRAFCTKFGQTPNRFRRAQNSV